MSNTRYKVLFIEDDRADQVAFERLVKSEGLPYDYTVVDSVSQARQNLHSESFDIIIVDYFLGDGTAFDVFGFAEKTPVILITGVGSEELAAKAMKAGAYDYLIKDLKSNYLKILPEVITNAVKNKELEEQLNRHYENLEKQIRLRSEELVAEKELLSATLTSMCDGVIATDTEKRIVLFNMMAENFTGWKFQEVENKLADEVFTVIDEKSKDVIDLIGRVIQSGQAQEGKSRECLVGKNGIEKPVKASAAPVHNSRGEIVNIVIVFSDVTREREIDHMKTNFISSVSHELRTPLTSIKAYTEMLLTLSNVSDEDRLKFLSVIKNESNRLTELVEDILEMSSIESGVVKINYKLLDIEEVISRIISLLQNIADEKNIILEVDIDDNTGWLEADESKIESVITNLLSNAIKFTPQQGCISVSVKRQEQELVIRVSDTGIGIPGQELQKIFDRFYRVPRQNCPSQGSGLGLAIVKEILAMHKGRIEVESHPGQGSTFTVILPVTAGKISPPIT